MCKLLSVLYFDSRNDSVRCKIGLFIGLCYKSYNFIDFCFILIQIYDYHTKGNTLTPMAMKPRMALHEGL